MTPIPFFTMDAGVWVLGSFLILIYLIGGRARAFLLDFLDGKADHVRRQMDEAETALKEAELLLKKVTALQAQSHLRTAEIMRHAEEECHRLRQAANLEIESFIQTEERLLNDRIAHRERSALLDIESKAIDIALKAAEGVIQNMVTSDNGGSFIQDTIRYMGTHTPTITTHH